MMPPSPNAVSPPPSPESSSPAPPDSIPAVPPPPAPARAGLWLYRTDLLLSIVLHLYLGLILFFLPWMRLWIFNPILLHYAAVAHFTQNGAVRGVISGLGLLNLWMALAEAFHFKDN
jgi:hypothetical protein